MVIHRCSHISVPVSAYMIQMTEPHPRCVRPRLAVYAAISGGGGLAKPLCTTLMQNYLHRAGTQFTPPM